MQLFLSGSRPAGTAHRTTSPDTSSCSRMRLPGVRQFSFHQALARVAASLSLCRWPLNWHRGLGGRSALLGMLQPRSTESDRSLPQSVSGYLLLCRRRDPQRPVPPGTLRATACDPGAPAEFCRTLQAAGRAADRWISAGHRSQRRVAALQVAPGVLRILDRERISSVAVRAAQPGELGEAALAASCGRRWLRSPHFGSQMYLDGPSCSPYTRSVLQCSFQAP